MHAVSRVLLALPLLIALAVGGCAETPKGDASLLDFLHDGSTLREDVHLRLGEPSAQYEAGRILAFRVARDAGGLYPVAPGEWPPDAFSLILVFDERGVLLRHALVRVHYR